MQSRGPAAGTSSAPFFRYMSLRVVISSSPRAEGLTLLRHLAATSPVVEVQAGDGVVALGVLGLFLHADGTLPFAVELHDAEALGVRARSSRRRWQRPLFSALATARRQDGLEKPLP